MSQWNKIILTTMIAVVFCSLSSGQAMAAATYRPSFDRNKHVYVDPQSSAHPTRPITLSDLESKLKEKAEQQGITVYVVFAEQGDDANPNTNMALPVLIDIKKAWWNQSGFDRDRHLLIVHVRQKGTDFKGKTAAEAGPALKKMGLTGNRFDAMQGPVMKAVYEHMKVAKPDHERFILAVVDHVNEDIAAYKESQSQPSTPPPSSGGGSSSSNDGVFLVVLLLVVGIGAVLGLFVLVSNVFSNEQERKSKQRREISALEDELKLARRELEKLEPELVSGIRPSEPVVSTGLTKDRLFELRIQHADLQNAFQVWSAQLSRAEQKLADWFGSTEAGLIVSVGTVTVDGVTGGRKFVSGQQVAVKTVRDHVKSGAASLKQASDKLKEELAAAQQCREAIDAHRARKEEYLSEKLNFEPLKSADDSLSGNLTSVAVKLSTDPLTGAKEYAALSESVKWLDERLEAGLRAHKRIPEAGAQLAALRKTVDEQRSGQIALDYPGAVVGDLDVSARSVKALLREDGLDPDSHISKATDLLKDARTALKTGRTVEADKYVEQVLEQCAFGNLELAEYRQARLSVEKRGLSDDAVLGLESKLDHYLPGELKLAYGSLEALKVRFRHESFEELDKGYDQAVDALNDARAQLSLCARNYLEQRFLAASRCLVRAQQCVQTAGAYRKTVVAKSAELQALVDRATKTSQAEAGLREQLAKAPAKGASDATKQQRVATLVLLDAFAVEVSKAQPNWRSAAAQADLVDKSLVQLGTCMEADKKSYDDAQKKLDDARRHGCPSDKLAAAQASADGGNFSAIDGMLVGYIAGSYLSRSSGSSCSSASSCSSSSGSSCSSSSGSSCSSCGGGGCGGGGCGG